ncbi:MAG: phenylacetate--CoA ligase family protein, partial [Burkholderiales bacterium]
MHPLAHTAMPFSALPGVAWPAVPAAEGARMLAMQFQFAQSERWSPARLRTAQFSQLTILLRHARETVPFYRERLAGIDLDRGLDDTAYTRIPLLKRSDVQDHFDALASRAVPRDHGRVHVGESSGSTGRPIRFLLTELNEMFWHAFTLRDHLWHRRDFAGKLAAIRGRVQPGVAAGWGDSTDSAFRTGPAVMFNTDASMQEQAAWLMREDPEYLISIAGNAQALARHCAREELRPARLREVRTYGEALHPDARAEIRAAWNVPVVDMYTCREGGYLALQCPRHEHYHVQAEGVYLELLNDANQPCAPGETGRVVITPLHNFAMPLIRYEIGDMAEAGVPCDCGRGMPVIRRVLGRFRSMLRRPGGGVRYPRFGEAQFTGIAPVLQYQVVQKSLQDIEVALVTARPLTAEEEGRLRAVIVKHLGDPFNVAFVYRDAIPRSAEGKYEEFRSEV